MNWEAFVTCAVTGAGATTHKSPHVPVTPEQIAAITARLPEWVDDGSGAEPFADGRQEQHRQLAAMYGQLRVAVTAVDAAGSRWSPIR